jgi:hypothetical protein
MQLRYSKHTEYSLGVFKRALTADVRRMSQSMQSRKASPTTAHRDEATRSIASATTTKMVKGTADLIWLFENFGECETPLCERTAYPRAPPKLSPPFYRASVKELAETGTISVTSPTTDIDNVIALQIKKCLGCAN